MNRNITALILIVLAIGIYFTYTNGKIAELKSIQAVNKDYQEAINNAGRLIDVRDAVVASYNAITNEDKERLNKLIPNNVDNVRLIVDVKDDIAARHGLALKSIKTTSPENQLQAGGTIPSAVVPTTPGSPALGMEQSGPVNIANQYGIVTLSFTVSTSYQTFVDFLKDLESSLRIMDVSKLTVTPNQTGTYDFAVEIKTYWLK